MDEDIYEHMPRWQRWFLQTIDEVKNKVKEKNESGKD